MSITYSLVQSSDIPRAYSLESSSYPSDEAASLSSLEYRQSQASNYFLGAYLSNELIGFICSTQTSSATLTHQSMETHEPHGEYLAIHSVCIDEKHRKKGIAKGLLNEYLKRVNDRGKLKGIRLISKEPLIGMYERVGFTNKGKSQVVHGKDTWFELAIDFDDSSTAPLESPFVRPEQEDVPSMEMRSPGKRLSTSTTNQDEVLKAVKGRDGMNLWDLYCPRGECRCLLVKKGTAKWVKTHQQDLDLPALPRRISAPSTPPTPAARPLGHWSLPSPLSFENIGFTRSLPSSSSSQSSPAPQANQQDIKYLTCADCDFGPLGWHDTQGRDLGAEVAAENEGEDANVRKGREFLMDVGRVRYKVE